MTQANPSIEDIKSRLAQLKSLHEAGTLSASQYDEARLALERQLVDLVLSGAVVAAAVPPATAPKQALAAAPRARWRARDAAAIHGRRRLLSMPALHQLLPLARFCENRRRGHYRAGAFFRPPGAGVYRAVHASPPVPRRSRAARQAERRMHLPGRTRLQCAGRQTAAMQRVPEHLEFSRLAGGLRGGPGSQGK